MSSLFAGCSASHSCELTRARVSSTPTLKTGGQDEPDAVATELRPFPRRSRFPWCWEPGPPEHFAAPRRAIDARRRSYSSRLIWELSTL